MKRESGMSYIMVCLCIIIITAIIISIIYIAKTGYKQEKIETIKTDMLSLQSKIKILSEEVIMKKEGASYIGKKVSENLEDEKINKLIQQNIIVAENESYDNYYILEKEEFEQLNLTDYDLEKVIVNYSNCEIIYPEGLKVDDQIYYKLSDFKEENQTLNDVNEITQE